MDSKNGKWASQILALRNSDGLWGNFHALSAPVKTYTTEQALRKLRILGYTLEDEPIQTAVGRMVQCIKGERKIDDYYEKKHDWPLFEKLMLSAWIRIFDPENSTALEVAYQWAALVEKAFESGAYNIENDRQAFYKMKGRKPKSIFETGFGMFYHAVLLKGVLSQKTERLFLDYYLSKPDGMFYIYDKPLCQTPEIFASRASSHYLSALDVLAEYGQAKDKLRFAAEWLSKNQDENGQWDFGPKANDGIYFPISDSWRKVKDRRADCTQKVRAFLKKLRA